MAIKVAINGFGRIGRLFARKVFLEHKDVEIVAINDLVPADDLAYLLKYDSTHGRFQGEITATENSFTVNGKTVKCLSEKDPSKLPWKEMGIDFDMISQGLGDKDSEFKEKRCKLVKKLCRRMCCGQLLITYVDVVTLIKG